MLFKRLSFRFASRIAASDRFCSEISTNDSMRTFLPLSETGTTVLSYRDFLSGSSYQDPLGRIHLLAEVSHRAFPHFGRTDEAVADGADH